MLCFLVSLVTVSVWFQAVVLAARREVALLSEKEVKYNSATQEPVLQCFRAIHRADNSTVGNAAQMKQSIESRQKFQTLRTVRLARYQSMAGAWDVCIKCSNSFANNM